MKGAAGERIAPIVALLLEREILSGRDLRELARVRARHPGSLEEALVRSGMVSDVAIAEAYADDLAVPLLASATDALAEECRSVRDLIPAEVCRACRIVALRRAGPALEVACVHPGDQAALDEAQFHAGLPIAPWAAPLGVVEALLERVHGARDLVREIAAGDGARGGEEAQSPVIDLGAPVAGDEEGQVIRLVNALLSTAVAEGASDIHLETYENRVRVRYRIDGHLEETTPPSAALFLPVLSRLKVLAKIDIAERRVPQDGAISGVLDGARIDFRVSTCPTIYGEKMVLRILAKEKTPDSLRALGFSARQEEDFLAALRAPHGLIFVTGPTGSGKSTTLYTGLALVNHPGINIATVEDPVEYRVDGMNQCHVRANVGMTFATALRAFLRQDPDLIMVGEVRDQETAQICLRAALTGHLVLSTLHTNDSLQAVHRLVDIGIEPFLLAPALRLVQAQRLVRRLCEACRRPNPLPPGAAERYGIPADAPLFRPGPEGCASCRGTGYRGRVGLFEVVPVHEDLRRLVATGAPLRAMRELVAARGTETLASASRRALLDGTTSLEEVAELLALAGPGEGP